MSISDSNKLIVHCCYHKVATTFFLKILRRVAQKFEWEFQSNSQVKKEKVLSTVQLFLASSTNTKVFLQGHSVIDFSQLPPYVGSHIIRDPRDMVISGYFYHLWCDEKWCHKPQEKYGGYSYQELLNKLSKEEGIAKEIERSYRTIKNMMNWDYSNPNLIEIKLEDLSQDEQETFTKIFQKYGFNEAQITTALSIVDKLSFEKRKGSSRGKENRKSHFRKGVAGDWKNHFTEEHKQLFKQMYPKALVKLGYESTEDW